MAYKTRNELLNVVQMAIHSLRRHVLLAASGGAFYRTNVIVTAFDQVTCKKKAKPLQDFSRWAGNEPVAQGLVEEIGQAK